MPRLLKDLRINDVSSVDRGAGEGVKVLLLKREFSEKEREHLADSGKALPDGSFPIANESDLHNAISAIGRAKDPAKAKAHIKSRAKAMGLESALPEDWTKRDDGVIDMRGLLRKDGAVDFDQAQEAEETRDAASGLICEINEAICALNCSVNSILCDDEVTDKVASISESFDQFKSHLAGLTPGEMEKAMTPEQLKKMIDDAVAAVTEPLAKQMADVQLENAVLKMSPEAQEFCKAMSPEDKKKFAAKSKKDQDDEVDEAKKRAASTIDPSIQKRLDQADADRIVLKALQEKDERATFVKRAEAIGLPAEQGEVLRKAAHGDQAAFAQVEELLKSAITARDAARDTGNIFKEFGSKQSNSGNSVSAYEQLIVKRDELRKTESGKKLTPEQAFAEVFSDPANADLVKRDKAERNRAAGIVS